LDYIIFIVSKKRKVNNYHMPLKLAFLFSTKAEIPYFAAFVASIG